MLLGLVLLGIMLARCLSGIQGNVGLNQKERVQQLSWKATLPQPKSTKAYFNMTTRRKGSKLKNELLVLRRMDTFNSFAKTMSATYSDAPTRNASNRLEVTISTGLLDKWINPTSTKGQPRKGHTDITSGTIELGEKATNVFATSGTEETFASSERLKNETSYLPYTLEQRFLRPPPVAEEREERPRPKRRTGRAGAAAGKGELNFRVIQRQFCPFTKVCKGPEPEPFTEDRSDVTPCCLPCSCEPSCLAKGTCCPDVEPQPPAADSTAGLSQCMLPVYPRGQQGKALRGYDVVVDCPGTYQNGRINRLCQGEAPGSLSDLVFVTDGQTNRIYANRYCAQCHGVSDMVFWGIKEAICNDFDFIYYTDFLHLVGTSEDLVKTVIELQCSIEFKPPVNLTGTAEVCYMLDNARTSCNETGLWDVYSQQIEDSCHAYELPYIHQSYDETEKRITSEYYGNIFCFLCNVPTEKAAMANKTCFLPQDNHDIMRVKDASAILDLDPLLQTIESDISKEQFNDSNPCIHLSETGEPMLLRCPILSIYHGGECVQVFRDVTDLMVVQIFDVKFLQNSQSSNDPGAIYRGIIRYFMDESAFVSSGCFVQSVEIKSKLNNGCPLGICTFIADVVVITTKGHCTAPELMKLFHWYMTTEQRVITDTLSAPVTLHISMVPGYETGTTYTLFSDYNYLDFTGVPIILTGTFYCPASAPISEGTKLDTLCRDLNLMCVENYTKPAWLQSEHNVFIPSTIMASSAPIALVSIFNLAGAVTLMQTLLWYHDL